MFIRIASDTAGFIVVNGKFKLYSQLHEASKIAVKSTFPVSSFLGLGHFFDTDKTDEFSLSIKMCAKYTFSHLQFEHIAQNRTDTNMFIYI